MRVKICGITSLHDAKMAVDMGASALGFNFYPKSPRFIKPMDAAAIIKKLPCNLLSVGIFVNPSHNDLIKIVTESEIQCIQLHGDESFEFCQQLTKPLIKAIRSFDENNFKQIELYAKLGTLLIDAPNVIHYGGTGELASWPQAKKLAARFPIILAGGLNAQNVKSAILTVQPDMVDVCSGVEQHLGIKSCEKMQAFFDAVFSQQQEEL